MNTKRTTRGRGVDFEQRFKASRWAENKVFEALHTERFLPVRLGTSKVAQIILRGDDEIDFKEPDLLVLDANRISASEQRKLEEQSFDLTEISPATLLQSNQWRFLWKAALFAVEVEFSPYKSTIMKGRNWKPRDPKTNRKLPKSANPPVAPNIWVKLEDMPRLGRWQEQFKTNIFIFHVFDEEAFGVSLSTLIEADKILNNLGDQPSVKWQLEKGIFRKEQNYNRGDQEAASERKKVFVVSPAASKRIGLVKGVEIKAQLGLSATGKYVTQVIFEDGFIEILPTMYELVGLED